MPWTAFPKAGPSTTSTCPTSSTWRRKTASRPRNKHHDGVALWDTKASDLSIPKQTAAKRDVLSPFVKEVRKQGLKLGLYYSLLDWSHPDYPNFTKDESRYAIADDPARWQRFLDFDKAQMTELSKAYKPDLFWFDGDWEQSAETWRSPEIIDLLTSFNKNVVVNSRIQGYGDYGTPEQGVPTIRPEDRYWELCYTINDSWGFQHTDLNFKTPQMVLKTFVDCLSMGGNLLLDIGPREDGTIPEEEVAVLKELGRWTRKHKEAVYGTRAGIPAGHVHGYTTLNEAGDVLYVYLPYKPVGHVEIKGLVNQVQRVWGPDAGLQGVQQGLLERNTGTAGDRRARTGAGSVHHGARHPAGRPRQTAPGSRPSHHRQLNEPCANI